MVVYLILLRLTPHTRLACIRSIASIFPAPISNAIYSSRLRTYLSPVSLCLFPKDSSPLALAFPKGKHPLRGWARELPPKGGKGNCCLRHSHKDDPNEVAFDLEEITLALRAFFPRFPEGESWGMGNGRPCLVKLGIFQISPWGIQSCFLLRRVVSLLIWPSPLPPPPFPVG